MTIEEAADYWDTHSLAEAPSREVEIEYSPEERDPEHHNVAAVVTASRPRRRADPAT